MKDIIQNSKARTNPMEYHHSKTHTLLYVLGIFTALVLISLIIVSLQKGARSGTPEQKLQALQRSAEPVLTTPEQQAANMDALRKGTKTPPSKQDQAATLNALNQ